jgi:MFS family permease
MVGALGLLIVSRVAQAGMPVTTTLIALGMAVGVGDGFLRTVNSAYLSENSTSDVRSHLFSAEFLVRMLAIFAGGLVGGFLPGIIGGAELAGFQWTITAGASVMAAGMVPMLFLHEEVHGVKNFGRVYVKTAKEFSAWGHLGRLIAPQAFLVAAGGLTAPFIPLYLKHTLGATVSQIGLIQGFGALVVGVAAFATPVLARKFGPSKAAMLLQAAALPLLFTVPLIGSLAFGVVVLMTRSTLMGIGGPLWNECSMNDVRAQDKPFVAGGLFFALSLTGFLGNIAGGKLMEISYTAPYIPAALLWALGTALTWLLWVRKPKTAEVAAPVMQQVTEWVPDHAGVQPTGELAPIPVELSGEAA